MSIATDAPPPAPDCGVPPEERRAVVVGASSGIGAAIVRQLVHEGYRVAALANRLAEGGVPVGTIKPGFVDTAMTKGKKTFWMIPADEAARLTLSGARSRANVRYVPRRWWLVGTAIRAIPSFLFRHLSV